MKKKFLMTGGWGRLGSQLRKLLPSLTPTRKEMDILNEGQLDDWFSREVYKGVIHLAAVSDCIYAAENKLLSYKTNVWGTRNVAWAAARHNLKIYYTSTDYVFDCKTGNYREGDNPNPANWYGYTKLAGEMEIQNLVESYCIIRTSFRPSNWPFKTAFTNVLTSADYPDVIAEEIALAIRLGVEGILHIGTAKKSLYDLAVRRNPNIEAEICKVANFPLNRYFNLSKWLRIKKGAEKR